MGSGGDDPPFLCVGTDVSAKYRGAFCEAKVKSLKKCVKCKIFLKETQSSIVVTDDCVKGTLKVGLTVEVKLPENGQVVEGVINKLTDTSMYTVVFDDGDEKTLRRTQLCLKGEKHFIESETLDNLPLSNPEHFGTPVMHTKKVKRGRYSAGTDDDDGDDSSSDESIQKRAEYRGRLHLLVGRVMVMETGDKRKLQIPVLVVLPDAHNTELRTKDHLLVKSFKDGKFIAILRKDLKEFSREMAQKNEEKTLKTAMDKALAYYENQDLPASWERDELLGTDGEDDTDDSDESSDDEPSEEKDLFVAQLYKFMDDRGTPINKGPSLSSKDLNLYRLFRIVQNIGGYNKVTNQAKWRVVHAKMKLPPSNAAAHQVKNAYKKYLHAFEDFYRKLGSTMGTISRPGRSRNNSGRGMMAFKKDSESVKKEIEKEFEEKESATGNKKDEEDSATKTDNKSPPKRVSRQEAASAVSAQKEVDEKASKKKEIDDKKTDKTPEVTKKVKRESLAKEEVVRHPSPKPVKKEKEAEKKTKKEEEDKETDQQQKKIIRRRSMRKDEKDEEGKSDSTDIMEKEDEATKKEVPQPEKEVKAKPKPVVKEKEDKVEKKEEDKKDSVKKITRKDLKKPSKSDEETESEKPKVKKVIKKTKAEEETPTTKNKEKVGAKKEGEADLKSPENTSKPNKKGPKVSAKTGDNESDEEVTKPTSSVDSSVEHPSGTKLQVRYGRGKNQKVYDAKVVESGKDGSHLQYLVHYAGWNNRYDEWIRPERIVKVLNRPSVADKIKKKLQAIKKRGKPCPSPKHSSSTPAIPESIQKPVSTSESSGMLSNQPVVKITRTPLANNNNSKGSNKSRQTRSNSTELKPTEPLPTAKPRRSRRSSGTIDYSEVPNLLQVSASASDVSDKSDVDAEEERDLLSASPEPADLDKNDSMDLHNDGDDRDSNASTPEMPSLERKVPLDSDIIQKLDEAELLSRSEDLEKGEKEKQQNTVKQEVSKDNSSDSKDKPELAREDSICAPKLEAISDSGLKDTAQLDNKENDIVKDSNIGVQELEKDDQIENQVNKVVPDMLDEIQKDFDAMDKKVDTEESVVTQVSAPVLEKQGDTNTESIVNADSLLAPDIDQNLQKGKNVSVDNNNVSVVDDRFEFRDDEDEITLPDLRAEAEKELKERQSQQKYEVIELEKRVMKGKKKESKIEKKEVKEKKEVRKTKLTTMAERKMVILSEPCNESHSEPPLKKSKEEKNTSERESFEIKQYSTTIDDVINSVCDRAREMAAEENDVEKKRKKKVKKKQDISETGESNKKDNANVKATRTPKYSRVKGKKIKDGGDIDSDNSSEKHNNTTGNTESCGNIDYIPVVPVSFADNSNKSQNVIKSVAFSGMNNTQQVLSGMDFLSDVALMDVRTRTDKSDLGGRGDSCSRINTVMENTPPTTPEHDSMDSAPCSSTQDHSSTTSSNQLELRMTSNVHSSISHEHFRASESLVGNTSPSSNDGSVGSGNVACSESSNGEVSVTPNHSKRRRESDEGTPSKKKRKAKCKSGMERKSARLLVGSDSDDTTNDKRLSLDSSLLHKGSSHSFRPPKYELNLEEGKYLEGEQRIRFIMEKMQEIRKVYMQLKSEVACIDRRKKRARRKERERERDSVNGSSTAAEVECSH